MGLFDMLFGEEEADDPKALPPHLVKCYINPHRTFGLDPDDTTVSMIRDAFRRTMLGFNCHFMGLAKSKMSVEQVLFSYHLLRKTITGPAQKIKAGWRTNPYMDFRPEDLLPLLRPLKGNFICPREYRGFRNLNIVCSSFRTVVSSSITSLGMPKSIFIFDVHYCMRRHTIEKDFDDFRALHFQLAEELLCVPQFPESTMLEALGLVPRDYTGEQLAEYVRRIHETLAIAGVFSPRLLKFLGIEFEKVQSEEEGAVLSLLDSALPPARSCWYIIDEKWLKLWRQFAMGRGPRRYLPPGKITNGELKEKAMAPGKKDLLVTKDYRCVTFNVYRFYQLVHGGGPIISRESEEIYSRPTTSYLHGVVLVQTRARMRIARAKKRLLYMARLSVTQQAKGIIIDTKKQETADQINDMIKSESERRTVEKLKRACALTQNMWRKKRDIVKEDNLLIVKLDQEVFSRAKGIPLDEPVGDEGLVVRDTHPILQIGNTSTYEKKITEEEGKIPFRIKKIPGTETAIIASTDNDQFVVGSKIASINGYPATSMTYEAVKRRLGTAAYPVILELERPYAREQVPTLDQIYKFTDETLQYNSFKILLSNELLLIKHNAGNKSTYLTRLRVSETDMFYRTKFNPKITEEDHWKKFSLFSIKFVSMGKDIEKVVGNKKLNPLFFFSVTTEEREELILELPKFEVLTKLLKEEHLLKHKGKETPLSPKEQKEFTQAKEANKNAMQDFMVMCNGTEIFSEYPSDLFSPRVDPKSKDRELENKPADEAFVGNLKLKYKDNDNWLAESSNKRIRQKEKDNTATDNLLYLADDEWQDLYHAEKTHKLYLMMNKLVSELRGSQIYVDGDGIPTIRRTAKTSLRKIA